MVRYSYFLQVNHDFLDGGFKFKHEKVHDSTKSSCSLLGKKHEKFHVKFSFSRYILRYISEL